MQRGLVAPIVMLIAVGLAGCFTTAADYRKDAETFILGDQGLAEDLGVGFESATCEEPANRNVGATFVCNAVDDQGADWEFEIKIRESNKYEVNVSRFPIDP